MSTAANPSHALALVVVDELARGGVTDAVLAPGSRSAALALALHDDGRIRLHVDIDERSAAFLAVGLARGSGRPAAVVTTSGTAAANLHPAVVEADAARLPLLALTADRPPELRHAGANQTIDQLRLFGPAVRWFVEVGVPEDRPGSNAYWRSTVCRALAEASGSSGPPGPVHLNLAFREPTLPVSDDGRSRSAPFVNDLAGRSDGRSWTAAPRVRRAPTDELVAALATRLSAARRGLIVAGDGADSTPGAVAEIHRLAQTLRWPLVAEPLSNARAGKQVIAAAHYLLGHEPFAAAHRPDLVLRVGRPALSRPLMQLLAEDVAQVAVDPWAGWPDPGRHAAALVAADPDALLAAVSARLQPSTAAGWLDAWRHADQAARAAVDAVLDAHDQPSEPRTARDVAAALPDGSTLVAASSMPVRDLDAVMAPRAGVRVVGNRGASGVDGFVSTALGVALATAGPTVALTGDLSLLHDGNGFLLAPAERVSCVFVVVNNDGGGIFHLLPGAPHGAGFERVLATPHGRDLARLAALHDLEHRRVERASELPAAVTTALASGGVALVEVRTDRADNAALHRRLQAAAGDALPA